MKTRCPSCDSDRTVLIGAIPRTAADFAGRPLAAPLPQSSLFRCPACSLLFRFPIPGKEYRDGLYRAGSPDAWHYELGERADWRIACDRIAAARSGGSILDIGCFDAAFLKHLTGRWDRYGLEINSEAAQRARAAGVAIVAQDIAAMRSLEQTFDVCTAFDMIEHLEWPLAFLGDMARLTKQGGYVIISSGNTDAFMWRVMRNRYWYCLIPEHLSFINRSWCAYAAGRCGLTIEHIALFAHTRAASPTRLAAEWAKQSLYALSPSLYMALRRAVTKGRSDRAAVPPYWLTNKDHLLVIFKKR